MLKNTFELLTCPHCQSQLRVMDCNTGLLCTHCKLVFPIWDNVPFLATDMEVPLKNWTAGIRQHTFLFSKENKQI